MSIRDRGSKKWVSIMYPELVTRLRQMYENEETVEPPFLDEHAQTEIQWTLQQAIHEQLPVQVRYIQNGKEYCVVGTLRSIHSEKQQLQLDDENQTVIPFSALAAVEIK